MFDLLYRLFRPMLFQLDAERAHDVTLKLIHHTIGLLPQRKPPSAKGRYTKELMGLSFPNAIGLAAGLDKNARYYHALAQLGFGFIEVGTVTPKPQVGNEKPRLFRVTESDAIINRFGFNNDGVQMMLERLQNRRFLGPLGVNIGKNKTTPASVAHEDYAYCYEKVYPFADYVTVNISSPNTPGLRDLQSEDALDVLLKRLKQIQSTLSDQTARHVPLLVKIAPDIEEEPLKGLVDVVMKHQIEGMIATNTTIQRSGIKQITPDLMTGGLSGKPLFTLSTHILKLLRTMVGEEMPLIGVGGVMSRRDAEEKFHAGADLVQLYSGLIYRGPGLVRDVLPASLER